LGWLRGEGGRIANSLDRSIRGATQAEGAGDRWLGRRPSPTSLRAAHSRHQATELLDRVETHGDLAAAAFAVGADLDFGAEVVTEAAFEVLDLALERAAGDEGFG